MTFLSHLIISLLAFAIITPSQSLHSTKDIYKLLSNQSSFPKPNLNNTHNLNTVDQHYFDACTAILKGYDDVNDDSGYDHDFAEWENLNPDVTVKFLDYFGNNKGLVSKVYTDDYYYLQFWSVYLIIYDGLGIDHKAAAVKISVSNPQSEMIFDQATATFTTPSSSTFTVSYGEYYEVVNQIDIVGQVSISFIDTTTNKPMSQFSPQQTSLKGKSFKLSFTSSDGSFSFNTTAFSDTYMTTSDTIITCGYLVVSFILVICSWYSKDMKGKVTLGTLQAFCASAAFIFFWAFLQPRYYGLFYFLLIIPALFNLIKNYPYLFADVTIESLMPAFGVIFSVYGGPLNFIPSIWINLFPSLILWFPFLQKLAKMKKDPYYLTRFEICSYLYVLLWMGYAFLYPRNFYRFGRNLTMIYISFGSIIFQFVVLGILEIITRKKLKQTTLLEDDSMNNQDANDQTKRSPTDDGEDPKSTPHVGTFPARKRREQKSLPS